MLENNRFFVLENNRFSVLENNRFSVLENNRCPIACMSTIHMYVHTRTQVRTICLEHVLTRIMMTQWQSQQMITMARAQ